MHIYYIEIICDDVFGTNIVRHSTYIFAKVIFTAVILPNIFHTLTRIFYLDYNWQYSCWFFCRIMSTISSQHRVR
jgi:hypothetical protein